MKNSGGFTLIEVIVAIFLITVGAGGAFSLIQKTLSFSAIASSRLVATYLAQESIETVRNIRDSNWLRQRSNRDEGISSTDWQPVYFLDGSQSKFQRKITIQKPGAGKVEVLIEVVWEEKGNSQRVLAQTELDNWR